MSKLAKPTNVKLEEYTDQFVAVIPTAKDPYHEQGKVYKIHPDVAKRFVADGMATYAPEGWEEGQETDELDSEQNDEVK